MRIVQRVLLYLVSLAIIAGGLTLFVYPTSELYQLIVNRLPHGQAWLLRYTLGCAAFAFGVFTLIPFEMFARKRRSISFPAEKGRTVIELHWFEDALKKTLVKLPIVKRADILVTPVDKDTKVKIEIKVFLSKSEDESTRDASDRLQKFADEAARSILGPNEVKSLEVHITNVQVDVKKTAQEFSKYPPAPIERPAPVAAAAATGAATLAHDDELDAEDYEVVEEAPESTEASVPVHSEDLLTYDEAASLPSPVEDHAAGEPGADHVAEDTFADDASAPSTSFESINDEPTDKTPNRDHE